MFKVTMFISSLTVSVQISKNSRIVYLMKAMKLPRISISMHCLLLPEMHVSLRLSMQFSCAWLRVIPPIRECVLHSSLQYGIRLNLELQA